MLARNVDPGRPRPGFSWSSNSNQQQKLTLKSSPLVFLTFSFSRKGNPSFVGVVSGYRLSVVPQTTAAPHLPCCRRPKRRPKVEAKNKILRASTVGNF